MKRRVLVAMSGGVDSSVAAALLKRQGFEVIGATIRFWSKEVCGLASARACCSLKAVQDAGSVAEKLGIAHYVFNLEKEFKKEVIDYFIESYTQGFTPNPCIICNEKIKWGGFLQKAKKIGADFIATGHYAKIDYDKRKRRFLLKEASYKEKDQSYVLFRLTQEKLAQTLLPLGYYSKSEVRGFAKEMEFSIFNKLESQEICFIPEGNKKQFFLKFSPEKVVPGPIVNKEGRILGQHKGIVFYTIGQREGLGIAHKSPLYVTKIDVTNNTLVVGEIEEAKSDSLVAQDLNWVSITGVQRPIEVEAKIRYRHPKVEAKIFPWGDKRLKVIFKEPQFAITPGQAVVFYKNGEVLGGGWIV